VDSFRFLQLLNESVKQLPVSSSLIPLFVICIILHHDETGDDLTLKTLYSRLYMYSDVGVKNHLSNLRLKGWIQIKPSNSDGRVKCVVGTKRLHAAFYKVTKGFR
jgi:DNA-binding MarR family transcriptional regulator